MGKVELVVESLPQFDLLCVEVDLVNTDTLFLGDTIIPIADATEYVFRD
jgi:hypothetical protein